MVSLGFLASPFVGLGLVLFLGSMHLFVLIRCGYISMYVSTLTEYLTMVTCILRCSKLCWFSKVRIYSGEDCSRLEWSRTIKFLGATIIFHSGERLPSSWPWYLLQLQCHARTSYCFIFQCTIGEFHRAKQPTFIFCSLVTPQKCRKAWTAEDSNWGINSVSQYIN